MPISPTLQDPSVFGATTQTGSLAATSPSDAGGIDPLAPQDPYQNETRLLEIFEQCKKEAMEYRYVWEREWLRDLYYVLGRQWIFYNTTRREWMDKRVQKWVPRPVTNKMAETVDSIRSVFSAINLSIIARPVGHDTESVAAAEIADQMAPCIHEEHQMGQVMREADFWLITTGNAVLQLSWDKDIRSNRSFIQNETCLTCGAVATPQDIQAAGNTCTECGGTAFQPSTNPDGTPAGTYVAFGKGKTTALSPFEYAFPSNITRWDDLPYLIRMRWRDKNWFEANRPDLLTKIIWEKSPSDRSLQIFKSLALSNDIGTGANMMSYGAAGAATVEGVTEYELWRKPTTEFPKGLLLRVIGDKQPLVLQEPEESVPGPLPYVDIQGNPLFPFLHAQYSHMGGRLLGRSALSPLIQKQDQLNQLDSLIQLIVQRMANPVWVVPEGAGIEHFTGEPGLVMKWNPLSAGGNGEPKRLAGSEVPATLYQLREQLLGDIESLAGCLTGDTAIPCLDGQYRTMNELAAQFPNGGMWVYGFDTDSMRVVPSYVEKAWSTGVKPTVRVAFKEGTYVDCTADHPFLTYSRGYVRADELKEDEAVVPLVLTETYKGSMAGYVFVTQPVDRKTESTHRMVAYNLLGLERGQSYLDVHHVDKNKSNNLPENLEVLTRREHLKKEPRGVMPRPTPEQCSEFSLKRWKDKTAAERKVEVAPMTSKLKEYWKNLTPAERSMRNRSTWNKMSKEQRQAHVEAVTESKRSMTAVQRAATGLKQSENMKAFWASQSEEYRNDRAAKMRANHRVASVITLGESEVFDLTTSTQNFGTAAGVFVHNTYDLLKGEKPAGVEAFSALQLLVERSQSRFTMVFQSRGEMYRRWANLAIELERQFGPQERTWAIVGPNKGYTFQHFQNAQLQGQITFVVEDGSTMPKTALGKRAAIEQANQLMLLNPADPDQRYALLQNFGLTDLAPSLNFHVQAALNIQDQFERWADSPVGPSPLIIKPWFDPQIHLTERIKWLNTDKLRELMFKNPQLEMVITQHLQALQQLVALTAAGAMAPHGGPPTGPQGPQKPAGGHPQGNHAPGGGQALRGSNRESGAPDTLPRGNAQSGPNVGPM